MSYKKMGQNCPVGYNTMDSLSLTYNNVWGELAGVFTPPFHLDVTLASYLANMTFDCPAVYKHAKHEYY